MAVAINGRFSRSESDKLSVLLALLNLHRGEDETRDPKPFRNAQRDKGGQELKDPLRKDPLDGLLKGAGVLRVPVRLNNDPVVVGIGPVSPFPTFYGEVTFTKPYDSKIFNNINYYSDGKGGWGTTMPIIF